MTSVTLSKALLRIRPAPLAVLLKHLLRIKRLVITTPNGRFWIDPVSVLGIRLMESGAYEPEMERAVRNLLTRNNTFVDIGANEGYFSILASRQIGPSGKVLAVEPQNRCIPVLQHNMLLNGCENISIANVAISDSQTTGRLYLSANTNTGASSMSRFFPYQQYSQPVNTILLSQLFDNEKIECANLVKIDIEGHEYEAVFGSPELFQSGRIRNIAMEFHPSLLEKRGRSQNTIGKFLRHCGYRLRNDYGISIYSLVV